MDEAVVQTRQQQLAAADDAAVQLAPTANGSPVQPCPLLWAIEVVVLGEDDRGVSDVALELGTGGNVLRSVTAADGMARFDGLVAGTYRVVPYELDRAAWESVSDEPLPAARKTSPAAAAWQAARPVATGPGILHTVASTDTTDSLAYTRGLLPENVWNHPRNEALHSTRESRNVLEPGDKIYLPPRDTADFSADTARRYVLRRLSVPARIRLRLFYDLHPWANLACTLEVTGQTALALTTSDEGVVEAFLPPNATSATLVYGPHATRVPLSVGALLPLHSPGGWRQRLSQLDFAIDPDETALSAATVDALTRFQEAYGLDRTGEPDAKTLETLFSLFDQQPTAPPPTAGVYNAVLSGG